MRRELDYNTSSKNIHSKKWDLYDKNISSKSKNELKNIRGYRYTSTDSNKSQHNLKKNYENQKNQSPLRKQRESLKDDQRKGSGDLNYNNSVDLVQNQQRLDSDQYKSKVIDRQTSLNSNTSSTKIYPVHNPNKITGDKERNE